MSSAFKASYSASLIHLTFPKASICYTPMMLPFLIPQRRFHFLSPNASLHRQIVTTHKWPQLFKQTGKGRAIDFSIWRGAGTAVCAGRHLFILSLFRILD